MKEKDTPRPNLINSEKTINLKHKDKYYNFFDYAPIALFIEDFSEVKKFVEKEASKRNIDIETLLTSELDVLDGLHTLVIIKEVNATAVELFKAKGKINLLENLDKVFTKDSAEGFKRLVLSILTGEKEAINETVNKTLEGEEIDIVVKYNVDAGSEKDLKNVIVSIEDITERSRVNTALAISEKRYQESQKIAKIASWFYDLKKKQLFWSNEAYNFVDLDPEEANLSLEFYVSLLHPEDIGKASDFSIENLLKNPNQTLNYRIFNTKKEIRHIHENRSVVIKNGKIIRVIGICQDITERVLSDSKLSSTKKLLSNTLSNIQDGFVILDDKSNYLFVNKVAVGLLGKTEAELLGKNIWEVFPEKEGDLFFDKYQKAVKTNTSLRFENYYSPWGRWFVNQIIPSNNTVLIFFHETTDKKTTENKIKEAYNIINKSSSVALLSKNDTDFPVIFASENAEKLFGYSSEELLSHKVKIHELVHPDDFLEVRKTFFTLIKGMDSKEVNPLCFRIVTKYKKVKWVETSIDVIKNEHGEIIQVQGIADDITERKKTEKLFFESNQRLQDQFNNTPLASIIWDLDLKVIEWNNSAHRIFGYSAEEAIGKHVKDLIAPINVEGKVDDIWQSLLLQKSGYRIKNKNITKYGETIICDWYNVRLKDVDGNIIGVASLADDITERVSSKKLLEKSEKKYRDIFEKSIDPVLILKKGVFVDCNESTLKTFGYSNKELLLQIHPSQLSPEIQPDGASSFDKSELMMKIAVEKGSNRFRWHHQKNNGDIFPAEVTLTRIGDENDNISIHAVVEDITKRVKTEEVEKILYNISKAALTIENFNEFGYFIRKELKKIIDTSNFYIAVYNEEKNMFTTPVVVDEKDETTEFSADKSLTGYVLKSKKSMLFTKESHTELTESGEVDLIGEDSKIWVGVPLKVQEKVFGVIVVQSYTNKHAFNDDDVHLLEFVADQISISILRKNAEGGLKKALLKAQESDRLKSAFLANMSHEIRTPMNGIIGFSELFLEKELSYSERKEYAEIVINSSKQLLSIVNDVLDISKIEAGAVQFNYVDINLNKLLSEIESFYVPVSQKNKLELICEKGLSDSASNINIDKTKLSQILTNLLSNAFKFTKEGSVIFGYELIDGNLQFWVKDTGIGIDDHLHDKIFDRFIQADNNFELKNKGTGLGLAISKKLVELFKGEIWLDSSKRGTTIYFKIPHIKAMKSEKISKVSIKEDIKKLKDKVTILVAEDEEYNLLYISELFSKTNYQIIEAINGEEAVRKFEENQNIDLVLMDIKMPIMDGYEAMKAIKEASPKTPVIALSAFAMESDKETALAKGFDFYLSKPIDRKLLFQVIEDYTE